MVNNINIHYEIIGDGKPIILLNPNSTNTNAVKFIANKLSQDFKVYFVAIQYPNSISKLIFCSSVARNGIIQKPTYAKILEKIPYYPGKRISCL